MYVCMCICICYTITQIIASLTSLGSEGLLSIPPIVGQQAQLFIDSFIAGQWCDDSDTANDTSAQQEPLHKGSAVVGDGSPELSGSSSGVDLAHRASSKGT
jgi:hypothetical protein